jgi:hypothetical protein
LARRSRLLSCAVFSPPVFPVTLEIRQTPYLKNESTYEVVIEKRYRKKIATESTERHGIFFINTKTFSLIPP